MKNLMVFNFESDENQVRILGTADNPIFCLPDICKVLGLQAAVVKRRLDKGVISSHTLQTAGGMRDSFDAVTLMTIANMELLMADEIMISLVKVLNQKQIFCAVSNRLMAYAQSAMLQRRIDNQLAVIQAAVA